MPEVKLSVVIPAFNAAATLGRAVDSALDSAADEVIVVDDGSTDMTADLARRHGAHVVSQENSGAGAARQAGLRLACGKYVVLLDADDELVPDGVRRSIKILDDDDGVVAAGGVVIGVRPDGSERSWPSKYDKISTSVILRTGFGPWPPGCAVIRRSALTSDDARLPPQLNTRYAEDFELFIRLSVTGELIRHPVAALKYRMYTGKSTTAARGVLECKQEIRRYYGPRLGMADHSLSPRSVNCQELLYRARHAQVSGASISAAVSLVRAGVVDPAQFIQSGWRFVQVRMAAMLTNGTAGRMAGRRT